MRATPFVLLLVSHSLTLACSDQSMPIAADNLGPRGTWVSDQASVTVTDNGTRVQILASGGCVGSYGEIAQPIPSGHFSLPGTYTQLIGAYPGRLDYAAQYVGLSNGKHLTLKITVTTLPQLGPFRLRSGVQPAWQQCLYP